MAMKVESAGEGAIGRVYRFRVVGGGYSSTLMKTRQYRQKGEGERVCYHLTSLEKKGIKAAEKRCLVIVYAQSHLGRDETWRGRKGTARMWALKLHAQMQMI